ISSAEAELPCPTCGRPAERQVSGGAGLLFKGSGFYITDYGKDGKKDQKSTKPEGGGSSEQKGEGSGAEKGGKSAATGGGGTSGSSSPGGSTGGSSSSGST